jgi:hypothetical protein
MQEEVKTRSQQMKVRGAVKDAILEGDPQYPALVATNLFTFFLWVAHQLNGLKTANFFNVESGCLENMRFFKLNINDSYNNDMGDVDVSDQLHISDCFDHWLRKRKGWWSIL